MANAVQANFKLPAVDMRVNLYAAHTIPSLYYNAIERALIRALSDVQENAALVLMFSILALILLFTVFCSCTKKRVIEPSTSLEALLTIVTPTSVAWPTDYDALFKHSTSLQSMTIRIRMSNFLHNVGAGTVELRNLNDLPHVFSGQLRAYGWLISLDVDFFLWSSILWWILASQIPGFISRYTIPSIMHQ